MTDKKVLSLITKEQTQKEDYQKDLLEIVDSFRKMIVDGEIIEFAISSLDVEGEIVITTCCKDLLGGNVGVTVGVVVGVWLGIGQELSTQGNPIEYVIGLPNTFGSLPQT